MQWTKVWPSSDLMASLVSHCLGAISTVDCKQKLTSTLWILNDWFKWLSKKYSVGWAHSKEHWIIHMILYSSTLIYRFHTCLTFKIRSQSKLWRKSLQRRIRSQSQRKMNQFYQALRLLQQMMIKKKKKLKKNKNRLKRIRKRKRKQKKKRKHWKLRKLRKKKKN